MLWKSLGNRSSGLLKKTSLKYFIGNHYRTLKGGDTMITVDQAVEMVTRGGYTYEEVYPLLSAKDQVLFQWSVIA
jgi:hypothetical protein